MYAWQRESAVWVEEQDDSTPRCAERRVNPSFVGAAARGAIRVHPLIRVQSVPSPHRAGPEEQIPACGEDES